jgi:radical S-adenosyl methionine domain-containing protein 2
MLIGFVSSPSLSSPWISPLLSSQPLPSSPLPPSPLLSVNLFPSRRCNYECGFCFHTAKNGRELTLAEAKAGLRLLAAAGTEKVNIAGGEPFMRPDFLGKLVSACADLGLKVTIISNGSLIRRAWMEEHGRHVRR